MAYTTTQAKEIRDALIGLGLRSRAKKHRAGYTDDSGRRVTFRVTDVPADFSVRTEGNGRIGWGEAYATLYTAKATQVVIDNAEALVEQGFEVTFFVKDGEFKSVHLSNGWTHRGIRTYDFAKKEFV